ncbi:hypothetical protein G6F50_018737 [Rhizopus delemar]|uniref:Pyruvate kinase C-terminal domain-containing protein n=1 Tax=Rhizopus delemar TaxID=936053 RepID=A0A9P6XLG5_9FUNG|nr:hypothetical protein G6F50_018737 [Rhizopus delemar]
MLIIELDGVCVIELDTKQMTYILYIGMEQAMKYGLLTPGEPVVAVQGWKGGLGNTNTLRIIYAPTP